MRTLSTHPGPMAGTARAGTAAWLLLQLGLFVLWTITFLGAVVAEYARNTSLWFPPTAVSFAALAVFGWRGAPAILLAAAASGFWDIPEGIPVSRIALNGVLFAFAHTLAYGSLAQLIRSRMNRQGNSLVETVSYFLIGGLAACVMAALLGTYTGSIGGYIDHDRAIGLIMPWIIGDYSGLLALGPLLLLFLRDVATRFGFTHLDALHAFDNMPRPNRDRTRLFLKLALILLVTAGGLAALALIPSHKPLLFVLLAPILLQLWVVHTQDVRESLVSIALFSITLSVMVPVLGLGEHALTLQFIMVILAAASYFGMAVPLLYADNTHLRRLLIRDSLTGAYSRYFFTELAQESIHKATLTGDAVALMMIDLDYLKRINDRYGHAEGDRILAGLVREFQATLRKTDVLGRLGGDEFCALLPDSDLEAAELCVERLQQRLRAANLILPDGERPGVSIGVAAIESDQDSFETLSQRADLAMYEAKRQGREGLRGGD